jgi:hypothetical protein
MKQEIQLDYITVAPETGIIEVGFLWDGAPSALTFQSAAQLIDANSQLLQQSSEAGRWLLYYLLALGATPETLSTYVGKKLVVDIGPAVQQTISLV